MSETSYVSERRMAEFLTLIKAYYEEHSPGGASSLAQLSDVELTNLQDGDGIFYDSTEEKFVNRAGGSGGASNLADLNDVSISSPSDGQDIEYDSTLHMFKNGSAKAPVSSIAPRETSINSTREYNEGDFLYIDDTLYKAVAHIDIGDQFISADVSTQNVSATNFSTEFVTLMTTVGTVNSAFNSLFGE